MLWKKFTIFSIILMLFTAAAYSQEDVLVLNPWDGNADNQLNAQIIADTTNNPGILATRVYELQRDQVYFLNTSVTIPAGATVRMRAAEGEGKKPVIYFDTNPSTSRPPGNMFTLNGGNVELKNICITGFFEDEWDRLGGIQAGILQVGAAGSSVILEGMILSNVNGQILRTNASTKLVKVTDCIFANMGALTTSNFGAGKGIDFRDVAHDTVLLVNNTFVNYQDRPIRHLDLSTGGTNTGAFKYIKIDHNTFLNGMGFHGLLSLGYVGDQVIITNNLFVDAFALGEDSTDVTRSAEWLNTGETYANGNGRMTWVLSVPNEATQWTVAGNYYAVGDEGLAWLNGDHFGHGAFGVGSPLSYYVNAKLGADSVNAFVREDDIMLNNRPNLMTTLMTWYEDPAMANRTKETGTFDVALHDYDRRKIEYFRDTLDAAYQTTAAAYTGAEEGFPSGDLNWFPDKKAQWEAGIIPFTLEVDGEKDDFYNTLTGPDDGYLQIRSFAHNDNGRPDDDADLSAKVWTGWNENWFYLYAEVKDDTVTAGTTTDVWATDNMELKFDPQAKDSVTNSIWDTRLTAPYEKATPIDTLSTVTDPANKRWVKKIIDGGYAFELAIRWPAIGSTEKVSVGVDSVFGMAINFHDNDGAGRKSSVTWAAFNLDAVYNTVKYLGTVKFLPDNKFMFIPTNNVTGRTNHNFPYDGSDEPVGVEENNYIPYIFSLRQNYPNPFNPSTRITFTLEKEGYASLTVYNVLGQKVATILSQELPAGEHFANFNASNLATGLYFYKLESGGNVSTKKMMLIK